VRHRELICAAKAGRNTQWSAWCKGFVYHGRPEAKLSIACARELLWSCNCDAPEVARTTLFETSKEWQGASERKRAREHTDTTKDVKTMKTKMFALFALAVTMISAAWAADMSALRPPAGARMAIVIFEDLQCPSCAHIDPLLLQAERNYHIPLIRHDFPILGHSWSMEAHIMARYFDTISPALGEEFRQYILANHSSIYRTNLRQYADRFAAEHHTAVPSFYDPTGALRSKVMADAEIGKGLGVHQTPTIYIVSDSKQKPYVELQDQSKLFETIEQVQSTLGPAPVRAKSKSRK